MSDDFDWRLLDRHLAGEASPGDDVALQRWLAADPQREGLLRALSSIMRAARDADWDTVVDDAHIERWHDWTRDGKHVPREEARR